MIYLDSAATSFQKPQAVLKAAEKALKTAFFRFPDPERVVLTMNATHALNMAIHALAEEGCRAVVSGFEHNAVIRPLHACKAQIRVAGKRLFDDDGLLDDFAKALPGAKLAVCTHVSNAFGYVLPIREISALCERNGVPLILDASQSAGVLDLDCSDLNAAFVAMPGHKSLLGIPGSGLLLCSAETKPLLFGGSGTDSIAREMPPYLPDRLEAGTQNAPAAAARIAATPAPLFFFRNERIAARTASAPAPSRAPVPTALAVISLVIRTPSSA